MSIKPMPLSRIPSSIKIYGDMTFRGKDHAEEAEQITFVNEIRKMGHGSLLIHIKNEGIRTRAQTSFDIASGMCIGAADIIILGSPVFVCELKRRHATKAKTTQAQIDFLVKADKAGCFTCYALGYEAAMEAFNDCLRLQA